ncbi:MAG: amidohydrolase family protein [Silicimonas sp.]|nr:amidohydrolase family protein [Silicimonas sp.]
MGFGNPLTVRLRDLNGAISLGSDIESGMAGDMFAVTRMALQAARYEANLACRDSEGSAPLDMPIAAREALEWATIGGARMLGIDDRTGSLSPGKQADILLLDARAINMRPVHDAVATILFHAGPQNVEAVWIAERPRNSLGV